jgi:excisionase family DNA binding protein
VLSQQFLSVKDVAGLLKVGEAAVRTWIKHGDLRAIDVGREWRIAPRDLESFLQRHANRPPERASSREGTPDGGSKPFRSPTETGPKQER